MPGNNPKNVIGIDFGTTSTYVTICPHGTRNKHPLYLSGKVPAVDTVILYSDDKDADPNVFPMIGENATITFGMTDPADVPGEGYRYRSNFKLEIVTNESARTCAVDFFKALSRDAILNSTPLLDGENRVIMGAPSQADGEFREVLRKVAGEAGFPRVEILDEPVGALLTDLGSGRFPLSDVLEGYLAIDFGGGTCDFAFLKGGQVVRSWGDFSLGGRLFDDLFYQWFEEQNPKTAKKLKSIKRDFYVWSYLCRRVKEDFSETVSRNPKAVVKAEVGRFGELKDLTREEFLARAGNYRPSPSFFEYCERLNVRLSDRLKKDKLDLVAWFSESLREGLGDISGIKAVSLSGGSSRWFFVRDVCLAVLNVDGGMILNTFNPFGAISEGLAILPAIRAEFDGIVKKLERDKLAFVENEITGHVKQSMGKCAEIAIRNIMTGLFDARIVPALKSCVGKETNIEKIESDVKAAISADEENLKAMTDKIFHGETNALVEIAYNKTEAWLLSHGLKLGRQRPAARRDLREPGVDGGMVGDHLANLLSAGLAGLMSAVTSAILATLSGGGGIALIAAGPHGLAAGAAGGLILGAAGWAMGRDKLKLWAKKQTLPKFFLKIVASERMTRKIRDNVQKNLEKRFDGLVSDFASKFSEDLDAVITKEIENLGIVNVF
ncbi:MAG: rod shape-determining protein [Deltaproteobacteria bacterium]|nr:rod shape-determining protein [Deltaproteobacteria bacterium]